jgi:AcrR family transcriptional regulator
VFNLFEVTLGSLVLDIEPRDVIWLANGASDLTEDTAGRGLATAKGTARRARQRVGIEQPHLPVTVDATVATVERIIEAAYRCIARHGYSKTTMDAIAREADLSRGTVYNYFSSKNEIVERIRLLEADKVTIQLRAKIRRLNNFSELLTECMFLITRIADENPYIRSMLDSRDEMSRWAQPSSPEHRHLRELWEKLLASAKSKGDLAPDLTMDGIISWLMLSQYMLLTKVQAVGITDEELLTFIRRFILKPLLPESSAGIVNPAK